MSLVAKDGVSVPAEVLNKTSAVILVEGEQSLSQENNPYRRRTALVQQPAEIGVELRLQSHLGQGLDHLLLFPAEFLGNLNGNLHINVASAADWPGRKPVPFEPKF